MATKIRMTRQDHMTMKAFEGRVGQIGQITIPAELRHRLGIKPKDIVQIIEVDGGIKVKPAESRLHKYFGSVTPHHRPVDWTAVRREFEELVAEDARTRGQQ